MSLIASLSAGFALGALTSKGNAPSATEPLASPKPTEDAQSEESASEEEDVADGDLSAVKPGFLEPCKMVDDICSLGSRVVNTFLVRYWSSALTWG